MQSYRSEIIIFALYKSCSRIGRKCVFLSFINNAAVWAYMYTKKLLSSVFLLIPGCNVPIAKRLIHVYLRMNKPRSRLIYRSYNYVGTLTTTVWAYVQEKVAVIGISFDPNV